MKKTNTLNSKIKQYASLAGGIAAASGATGQVVYTDINPDEVLSIGGTTQYQLNLDGDAATDMIFLMQSGTGVTGSLYGIPYTATYAGGAAAFGTSAATTNGWLGNTSSGPFAVPMSSMISSGAAFVQAQGTLGAYITAYLGAPYNMTVNTNAGNFIGAEGFVGIRFDISGQTHYGWARVEVAPNGQSMTIKDYAYESTPGLPIAAGNIGSTDINEHSIENLISFYNNRNNKITIKNNGVTNAFISVVALDGKLISNKKLNNKIEELDLSTLSNGIYIINITADEGNISKKFYVR